MRTGFADGPGTDINLSATNFVIPNLPGGARAARGLERARALRALACGFRKVLAPFERKTRAERQLTQIVLTPLPGNFEVRDFFMDFRVLLVDGMREV